MKLKYLVTALILLLVVIFILITGVLYIPAFQTYLTGRLLSGLSGKLNTTISIDRVKLVFPTSLRLENLYIEDQQGDTLLFTGALELNIAMLHLLRKEIYIEAVDIDRPVINLRRWTEGDTMVYSHAFLTALFQSEKQDTSQPFSWIIQPEKLDIHRLRFTFVDQVGKKKMNIAANEIYAGIRHLDFKQPHFDLGEIDILKPVVVIERYDTAGIELHQKDSLSSPEDILHINATNFEAFADKISITSGYFRYWDNTRPAPETASIDYAHLAIDSISFQATGAAFMYDTIIADIQHLSARERSGFHIKAMRSNVLFSATGLACDSLDLKTRNSHLHGTYHMAYNTLRDFNRFVEAVKMRCNFSDAYLSFEDLAYFTRELKPFAHVKLFLSGDIQGTVSDLKSRHLTVKTGQYTTFSGKVSLNGLPDIANTFIDFKADKLTSSAADLKAIYPKAVFTDELYRLGKVNFQGRFIGFINDFVAYGKMITSIGTVTSDINFKINKATGNAFYTGKLNTYNFNLGKFWNNEEWFGRVTLSSTIEGSSLQLENLDLRAMAKINSLELKGNTFKDILIDGNFRKKLFTGSLVVNDRIVAVDFNGTIDFNEQVPEFRFTSKIRHAYLKKLNLTQDDYVISTDLDLDFKGIKIDEITGRIGIYNTVMTKNGMPFIIDTIQVVADNIANSGRSFELHSDVADLEMKGNFKVSEMPGVIRKFISNYFSFKLGEDVEEIPDQQWSFRLDIPNSSNLTRLIHKNFKRIKNTYISGKFDSKNLFLKMDIQSGLIHYGNFKVNNTFIKSYTDKSKFHFIADVDQGWLNDSTIFDFLQLQASISGDSLLYSLQIEPDSAENHLHLHGNMVVQDSLVKLHFLPSDIQLVGHRWDIDPDNYLLIGNRFLKAEKMILSSGVQKFSIKISQTQDHKHLVASLQSFQLGDVYRFFFKGSKFKLMGVVNGQVGFTLSRESPQIAGNLNITGLALNKYSLGDFTCLAVYNPATASTGLEGRLTGSDNELMINGNYQFGEEADKLNVNIDVAKLQLATFNPFVTGVFSSLTGMATGKLQLGGSSKEPVLTGSLNVNQLSLHVDYLNTSYRIPQATLTFSERWIDIGSTIAYDTDNNTATLGGQIFHDHLKNFTLDIFLKTNRFKALNTTYADNQTFYGTAYGKGTVLFQGPLNNIEIYINAKTLKDTRMSVPVSTPALTDDYTFYKFINPNGNTIDTTIQEKFAVKKNKLQLDMALELTPEAQIEIIFDMNEGDILKAEGKGNLNMFLSPLGDFNMAGSFEVESGEYIFTLQNVINKKFSLYRGGIINWSGDPYQAQMDINAVYRLRAAPYNFIAELIPDSDDKIKQAKNRVPVEVFLHLTGSLLQPNVDFDIQIEDVNPSIKSEVETKLQMIKQNENAMNRQVFGLLVLNRFLPEPETSSEVVSQTAFLSDVNNTVSEFLSNQLSNYLTDWISTFVTDLNVDISYRSYELETLDPTQPVFENRRELQLALSKQLFNDRVRIDIGGNFDFGENTDQATGTANNVAGDFVIEYSITEDGRIKIKGFRKGEYDIFSQGNKNRQGVAIYYSEEFDKINEIGKRLREKRKLRKKAKEEKEQQTTNQ